MPSKLIAINMYKPQNLLPDAHSKKRGTTVQSVKMTIIPNSTLYRKIAITANFIIDSFWLVTRSSVAIPFHTQYVWLWFASKFDSTSTRFPKSFHSLQPRCLSLAIHPNQSVTQALLPILIIKFLTGGRLNVLTWSWFYSLCIVLLLPLSFSAAVRYLICLDTTGNVWRHFVQGGVCLRVVS